MSTKLSLIYFFYSASLVCSQTSAPDDGTSDGSGAVTGIIVTLIFVVMGLCSAYYYYRKCRRKCCKKTHPRANFPEIQAIFDNSTIIKNERQRSKAASQAWKRYKNSRNWQHDMDRLRQQHLGGANPHSQLATKPNPEPTIIVVATPEPKKNTISNIFKMKKSKAVDDGMKTAEELPKGWRRCSKADGKVYYQNDITKTTQWDKPQSTMEQPQQQELDELQKLDGDEEKETANSSQKERAVNVNESKAKKGFGGFGGFGGFNGFKGFGGFGASNKKKREIPDEASKAVNEPQSTMEQPQQIKDEKARENAETELYHLDNEEDEKVAANQEVVNQFMSELNQLLSVIQSHMNFMKAQEKNVLKFISSSGQNAKMLENAKNAALETEKDLLQKIMNISTMNEFLSEVILIENLFNFVYTEKLRAAQKEAREKYAPNLSKYETTDSKPITKAQSFVDLLFYAQTDLSYFKKWLQKVANKCKGENIKIASNSGARQKNIERAFYKSFYVYSATHGERGYQQMTDVLRCSLVFDDFVDLYKCFAIIEKLSESNGGILRAKDRFNPQQIPFGYRDILININCPKSEIPIICEVQLHHSAFYQHKKVSHDMYKIARIFEDRSTEYNLAYKYANQYTRSTVGSKIYQYKDGAVDSVDPRQLLTEWGLSQYFEKLTVEGGYDEVEDWKDLTLSDLTGDKLGFKEGHAKRFRKRVQSM